MPTKIQIDDNLISIEDLPQPIVALIETKMRWDAEFADLQAKHNLASASLQQQLTDSINQLIKAKK